MRKLVQVIPQSLRILWYNWELRVLVLLSLTLQLSLLHFSRQRRYNVKVWIHAFLWSSYIVTDAVASFALGITFNKQGYFGNDTNIQNDLMVFWASFMMLHLGGPDTITAYARQDNELWLRHFLGLVFQSGVALYIFLTAWEGKWISFLTILVFLAGFIKFAERVWVMRSTNSSPVDADVIGVTKSTDELVTFHRLRHLFLYQKIHFALREGIHEQFQNYGFEKAFERIEIELGYAYDYFYTKTPLFWDRGYGCLCRCVTLSSTVFAFLFFVLKERHNHLQIDLIITYILLGGALVIEIYAVILQVAPDKSPRWSNSIGQFNMLSFCSKIKPEIASQGTLELFADLRRQFFSCIISILTKKNRGLQMLFYKTNKQVSSELKRLVWDMIQEKSNLHKPGFSMDYNLRYLTRDKSVHVEIEESIIIWHLATEFCFYTDNVGNAEADKQKVIKEISDYMVYILAFCPFLLSAGSAVFTFETSCRQVEYNIGLDGNESSMSLVVEKLTSRLSKKNEFRKELLQKAELLPCANLVAQDLIKNEPQKWDILTNFWLENLAHVATLCLGSNHAQQLRKGGEFLTHVWFLIEHLDLKERFRMPLTEPQQEEHIAP